MSVSENRTSEWMRKQRELTGGKVVREAIIEIDRIKEIQKSEAFKARLWDQGGKARIEIHAIIRKMVEQENTEEEIIEALRENPEYEQFLEYAKGWIADQQKKKEGEFERDASKMITQMLQEERTTGEILQELNKVAKYQRYANHFENWIEARRQKMILDYRRGICATILRRLQKGKTEQEILEELMKRPEYDKYSEFYPEWIEQVKTLKGEKEIEK